MTRAAAEAIAVKLQTALAMHQQGQLDLAETLYREILQSQPLHFDALQLLATIAAQQGNSPMAVELFERALMVKPDYAPALSNRGTALLELQRPEEALESFDRALKIKPDYALALHGRGNTLRELQRYEEALESYGRALEIKPDYAEVHWNESLCRLLLGDFDLGWRKYEWRWKHGPSLSAVRSFAQPLWLGEVPLAGKTILLHAEHGFGDTLQFCRYAQLVAARGARVVLEVPPALKSLCQTLAGVDTLLDYTEGLPPFDFQTPLMSLPLAFGTRLDSIPADVPYLHSDPQKVAAWHALLGPRNKPRVGLVWGGSPAHGNDRNRSLPLALLADLIGDAGEFICLQKEFRKEDELFVRQHSNIRVFSERLRDFADTAALIETLDLVITVDTSVAHLAGALGKPVWVLLPFAPDFRWLLEREDSPWYPTARLFRQSQFGQWAPVLAEVRKALAARFNDGSA
jgi:Flp pilus assembly protein TadD